MADRPERRYIEKMIDSLPRSPASSATCSDERKAKNLARNPRCILMAGCNKLDGLDLVVEGCKGERPHRGVADTFESKYGVHFTAPEGTWFGNGKGCWLGRS